MPSSAQTWWWIGIGSGITVLTGTGLILIGLGRRRHAPISDLGTRRPPIPPKRKPTIPPPPEPIPPEFKTETKRRDGNLDAGADPDLRYTDHLLTLFKLPRGQGEFNVETCVKLQYDLDDVTWNTILTRVADGTSQRLFFVPNLNLSAGITLSGRWSGNRIHDLDAEARYLGCTAAARFPEVNAYFAKQQGRYMSWGGELSRTPQPAEHWGNGYLPRFGVRIEDGYLKLRIQVAPMISARLVLAGDPLESVARITPHRTPYAYQYRAKIEYQA